MGNDQSYNRGDPYVNRGGTPDMPYSSTNPMHIKRGNTPDMPYKSRVQSFLRLLVVGAALYFGIPRSGYAPASWNGITEISTPTGLSSSQNPPPNDTSNDHTYSLEIILDENALLKVITTPPPLTNPDTGDTLSATYQFTTDGDGRRDSGVPRSGSTRAQGKDVFVPPEDFLSDGVPLNYVPPDNNCILYITLRASNPNDYGRNSDLTKAPDSGSYNAGVGLRLTTQP